MAKVGENVRKFLERFKEVCKNSSSNGEMNSKK
jgi:hypothetical protein